MSRQFGLHGYVLSRREVGEADTIITFFSRERGKPTFMARGIRRGNAKLAGQLEAYHELRLRLVEGRGLPIVTASEIIAPWRSDTDYELLITAQAALELTSLTVGEEVPDSVWYEHLQITMRELPLVASSRRELLWLNLLVQSLEALGISPGLPTIVEDNHLDIREGRWQTRGGHSISLTALKLWRFLLSAQPSDVQRLKGSDTATQELLPIVEQFWRYHSGQNLRARSLA